MRQPRLWRNQDFRNLWAAVVVSTYGSLVRGTALVFTAIFLLDASAVEIGALRVAELLPGFLVGLVAGAWVDRVRRRPVMMTADLARALALVTVPAAAALGVLGFGHLFAVAALVSIFGVFFDVAYQSFLPSLVAKDELIAGNSALSAAMSVVEAIAFSTGGWLVQLLTAPTAVLVDAVTFVASAGFLARIQTAEPEPVATASKEPALRSIVAEIGEGLGAVWRHGVLRGMILAGIAQNAAFGVMGTVFLLYLNQEVGFEPGILGMIFAVGGVSSFAGAVIANRLTRPGIGAVMLLTLIMAAVGEAFVPMVTAANAAAVGLLVGQQLVTDSALTIYDINQVSLRQAIAPARLLGRVNASARVTEAGAVLTGTAAASLLGEMIGLRGTLWVGVGLSLVAAMTLAASPVRALARIPAAAVEVPA